MRSDLPVRQVFYTIDHETLLPISKKDRVDVHRDGDWHMAVTAFIFRKNLDDEIEVLVQERSEYVDIAQKHFDQSLATQLLVEDGNDTEAALYRGLREELGLRREDVENIKLWNKPGDLYISKQYKSNPELWNREVVCNYLVYVKNNVRMAKNFKVQGLEWLPWEELCNLIKVRPNKFTKSVRLFCVFDDVADDIYANMRDMAAGMLPKSHFDGKMFYYSLPDVDVLSVKNANSTDWIIDIYSTDYSMSKRKHVLKKNISKLEKMIFADDNDRQSKLTMEELENL